MNGRRRAQKEKKAKKSNLRLMIFKRVFFSLILWWHFSCEWPSSLNNIARRRKSCHSTLQLNGMSYIIINPNILLSVTHSSRRFTIFISIRNAHTRKMKADFFPYFKCYFYSQRTMHMVTACGLTLKNQHKEENHQQQFMELWCTINKRMKIS